MTRRDDLDELQRLLRRVLRGLRHRQGPPAELRQAFGHGKLGPRHAGALTVVAREQPLSVGSLAEQLGVTLTSTSLIVSELADAGLVERREDPEDRRRTIVTVAEHVRPAVDGWLTTRAEPLRKALDRLQPPERDGLLSGLAALAEELDQGPRCHPHGPHRARGRRGS
jgi:DNA-binding MarR family transcriptional regulator